MPKKMDWYKIKIDRLNQSTIISSKVTIVHHNRHGHCSYFEVKAIVKSIVCPKRWTNKWSRHFCFLKEFQVISLPKKFNDSIVRENNVKKI